MFSPNILGFKPLKGKKTKTVPNGFIETVNESKCKRNKLWADQGREFYNNLMQKWLDDILIFLTHNEDNGYCEAHKNFKG